MDLRLVFLPIILFLGIITSYEDIKEGKIRNKWLLIALGLGVLANFVLYTNQIISLSYVGELLLYSFFALIVGFFIWMINLWSAGDAKLFAVFFFLSPLDYSGSGTTELITLLINSIVPIFLFLVIKAIVKTTWNEKITLLKRVFGLKRIGEYLILVFSLGWVVSILFGFLANNTTVMIPRDTLTSLLGIIVLSQAVRMLLGIKQLVKIGITPMKVFILLSIARIIFNFDQMIVLSFWQNYLVTTLGFALVIMLISDIGIYFTERIQVKEVKVGMIPAEMAFRKGKEGYQKRDASKIGLNAFSNDKNPLFRIQPEGLDKAEVSKIKKEYRMKRLGFNTLRVQKTFAFAPFISLGAVLTLLLGGNIMYIIVSFL